MKKKMMKQNVKELSKVMKNLNLNKMEKYQDDYMDMMEQMEEMNELNNMSYTIDGDLSNEAMLAELVEMEEQQQFKDMQTHDEYSTNLYQSNNNPVNNDM
eukprot:CAMPEP_0117425598 /NCGR_PEP_ID=MMETSP0758-20121206/5851_1 /TAXON_ID=63605 /ORGANISM="Percolomonas cosmopolitus, Strain AE-1 (ATCC 50343)" /LENGTH=99 /DNA_ID=CAMNT_0005210205 /DNA_START=324 /DNA_END=620 /DNA_ORIENTATION=-